MRDVVKSIYICSEQKDPQFQACLRAGAKMKKKTGKEIEIAQAQSNGYKNLVTQIGSLLVESRKQVFQAVNTTLVNTYWQIGRHIVEYEQDGNKPNMEQNCWITSLRT